MIPLTIDCLLFVEEKSPLNIAFETLLGPKSGIKAIKSNAEDLQGLVDEMHDLKSQVVILEDLTIKPEENFIASLLSSDSELKIIIVLRESNYMYTFKKEEIMIKSSSDLLDAIRSVSQTRDKEIPNANT